MALRLDRTDANNLYDSVLIACLAVPMDAEADASYDWALDLSGNLFGDASPTTAFFREQYSYHLRAAVRGQEALFYSSD